MATLPENRNSEYWKEYLAKCSPCYLLRQNPEPSGAHKTLLSHSVNLFSNYSSELCAFSKKNGLNASSVYQVAWAMVLRAFTGLDSVCFGYTFLGRKASRSSPDETERPVMLACRVDFTTTTATSELLKLAEDDTRRASTFQQSLLPDVLQSLTDSGEAMFNTCIIFLPEQQEGTPLSERSKINKSHFNFLPGYDVVVECEIVRSRVRAKLHYNVMVVSSVQAERLAETLSQAIATIVVEDKKPSLLGGLDREQLSQWNGTVPALVKRCVHELIIERCRAQPEAQAVCAWDGEFTYGELDALSSLLAVHLQAAYGVGPEIFVPLCFEKSRWTTVAIVGVMKAGGAFVLLDPSHPQSRLQEICQAVSASVIVASPQNIKKAATLAARVAVVSDLVVDCRLGNISPADSSSASNNAVYAAFTSGSTGTPKGAVIEHATFCAAAMSHTKAFSLTTKSRVFQFSSYAFGASVVENLSTLIVGGCICVPSDAARKNDIAAAVSQLSANWVIFTPSTARILSPEKLATIETVVLGGELITQRDLRTWHGRVRLVNAYGHAECSTIVTVNPDILATESNNIGRAAGGVCWVVDANNHEILLPIGAVGELLIEGPIVGRGYLNDAKQTAAAFIEAPEWLREFRGKHTTGPSKGRLYKTGDLVQYTSGGSLRCLGRKDTQVKIRGQRIELSDVEHHVRQCFPGACEVVAEVTPEGMRPRMLVAFVLTDSRSGIKSSNNEGDDHEFDTNKILAAPTDEFGVAIPLAESALLNVVPSYMVPAMFLPLAVVPLTQTGKTDRRRLRDHAATLSSAEIDCYREPQLVRRTPATAAEQTLQRLWARVLDMTPTSISADDSFFRLGGDSITAMQLVGAARDDGFSLTVTDVFQHSTLCGLARVLQEASTNDSAIESFALLGTKELRHAVIQTAVEQCHLQENQITDIYPCTAMQEAFMALAAKFQEAYTAEFSYRLPTKVDLDQLFTAWKAVARANPILNTRIIHGGGTLGSFQVVAPQDLPWGIFENEDAYITHKTFRSFGLGKPMVCAAVIKAHGHISSPQLILTMHHAVFDALSLRLLLEQAEKAYYGQALIHRPFSPFLEYSRDSQAMAADFWLSELAQADAVPFPPIPTPAYIPAPTESMIHKIVLEKGQAENFTLSTRLKLAWALTLSQYTSTSDIIFGLTVTGRGAPVAGVEQMTGPTIATIPFRVQLVQQTTVMQALQQVQDFSTRIMLHEQIGLQYIRRLGMDAGAACQFQNLLVIQPRRSSAKSEFFIEQGVVADQGAFSSYALTIICEQLLGSMTVQAIYDQKVIGKSVVARILCQLDHVMEQISHHPDAFIADIGGVKSEDLEQLRQWNGKVPARVDQCVHELIAEQCRAQPAAPAVCAWDGNLTYSELDMLSSALAAHLVTCGVGPEVFVPLCFEKSLWLIVAIVAVIKAGGAFILLDPSHPAARRREICRAVLANLVVVSMSQAAAAGELAAQVVMVGDAMTATWQHSSTPWETFSVTPDNALYAVFTSGSTGIPKGVVIPHYAFSTSALAHGKSLGITNRSRVLQFSSCAFDMSLFEMLTTLLMGGCVCVPSDMERKSDIDGFIQRLGVNCAMLTPSVLSTLDPQRVPSLKTLAVGGEPVSSTITERWSSSVYLALVYGPTECAVLSTMDGSIGLGSDPRSIGYATGCVCWVVDRDNHERLVPIGALGELLIEGPIVGRGYLNNPEQTAAAFIDPPAWLREFRPRESADASHRGPGTRQLYKTGDLVQCAANGLLRFVGRKDTQVKLRGQRIELGEVEYHTRQSFQDARDVVAEVVAPAEAGRPPFLAAFVSLCQEEERQIPDQEDTKDILAPPTDAFRAAIPAAKAALHDTLPAYMVPALFLPIVAMPLTTTGKTNRRLLRERAAALSLAETNAYRGLAVTKRAPATLTERMLQQLWAKVLNMPTDTIGVDDSFFRLGGDSITAMQLSAASRAAGFSLSVSDIFLAKSISQLSPRLVSDYCTILETQEIVDIPFELSPMQRLFFELAPHAPKHFNQSFLLPVARQLAPEDVARAVKMIVHEHSMLRARFSQVDDGCWTQAVSADVDRSFRFQCCTAASLEHAKDTVYVSQRSLDLQDGPLFAVDLIDVSGSEQYLFLVAHHLVIDLVSWRVILGDLEELLQTGKVSGNKPLPFQSWCRLQAEYSRETLFPTVALPRRIPPAPQDYWGQVSHLNSYSDTLRGGFTISKELTTAIFGAANDALHTQPVEIFQAALWHSFVQAFPDRPPPTIFNEGHGREPWDPAIDLSRTVGWFTTMWPTCIEMGSDRDDIVDVIRRTKDTRRRTPSNGWAYFASRFLNPKGQTAFRTQGPVEIAFNYLGLYQQLEREGSILRPPIRLQDHPSDVAGDVQRFALIDVSASVERGCLQFLFCYSQHLQHQDAISRWIANCEQSLLDAVQQLLPMDRTYTLCDFPLLPLTYSNLDRLLDHILPHIGVSRRDVEDAYPCSPMQRGILLSQDKDPRLYRPRFVWKVVPDVGPRPVNLGRLRQAWQQVVDRHTILRTVFVESVSEAGYTNQLVRRSVSADVEVVECTDNDPIEALEKHPVAAGRDGQPPHCLLLSATSTETYCALEISHALIDAHSSRILQRDLQLAYGGQLPTTPGPPYQDYIAYLRGLSEPAAETYWRTYLDGIEPSLFPIAGGGEPGRSEQKQLQSTCISLGSGARIREFCQHHDVTMSNLFQVAWGLVLQTYIGLDAVCFGYLNSGRDVAVAGVQDIVGPFINMLLCRVELTPGKSLLSLLQKNHTEYLQSLPHQHYSLADILHLVNMSGQPLFNTVMSLQRPGRSEESGETRIRLEAVGGQDPTEYDIAVTIGITNEDIQVTLNYWTTTRSRQGARDIARTFRKTVHAMIDRPNDAARELDILSEEDRRRLQQWNGEVPARSDRCVHELIAERCQAQPAAPAVCAWDGDLTYSELDQLSSALAAHLAKYGVGPEVFVPLCFEKSRWTIVAMVGVIKAGGAFVLLDPSHPVARHREICRAVSAGLVVASLLQAVAMADLAAQVVIAGDAEITWQHSKAQWEGLSVTPDNALYAIFTSGSTGTPKGAIIHHAAFATSALAHGPRLHLTSQARVLQFVSYGFDVSISDVLTTLIFGACVCVPSDPERANDLALTVDKYKVNWAHLTPSLIDILQPKSVPALQVLALTGEPMAKSVVEMWGSRVQLMNSYGPAECAVVSTIHGSLTSPSDACRIGEGSGCVCWVVDREDHERLVPIGAVGELLIEGPIVGRGYLNDPERTAAAFIDPPAWLREFRQINDTRDASRGRLYKTGDLVLYTADGLLRFVGRKDTQVKLRGQRIELGEVEHHTQRSFPGARDVVAEVVTPVEAGRPPLLVAFVWADGLSNSNLSEKGDSDILAAPTNGFHAAIPAAKAALHNAVPVYMVPALFLPIVVVPLTATGKTNRRLLRERAAALSLAETNAYHGLAVAKRAPATLAEQKLQQLWAKVLNIPANTIGADDSFFRLGGDSIAAIKLVGAARDDSLTLTVADVFKFPNLARQAKLVISAASQTDVTASPASFS